MQSLYLTSNSISYLAQVILASVTAVYFWYRVAAALPTAAWRLPTALLAGAFTAFAAVALLLFFNVSLYPDLGLLAVPWESPLLGVCFLLLLQFAYRFPVLHPAHQWEARGVLALSLLDLAWETQHALWRHQVLLTDGHILYRPPEADIPLVLAFGWGCVVLLRQSARASGFDESPAALWRALRRPQGQAARATRALALLALFIVGLEIVELLKGYLRPFMFSDLLLSLGALFTIAAFGLTYLSDFPESASLLVRQVGLTLTVMLAVLSCVGWSLAPAYHAAYADSAGRMDHQTIRFTPNPSGGYDAHSAPFHFDEDLGTPLAASPTGLSLAFDFPFFGRAWRAAQISAAGFINFGAPLSARDVLYRYGSTPALFPLLAPLTLAPKSLTPGGGLFANAASDKLVVTWNQLAEADDWARRYTFQLTLYPNGVFEMTYDGLPASLALDIHNPQAAPWLAGVASGSASPQLMRWAAGTSHTSGAGGLIDDYYFDFRRYTHELLAPLAYWLVGSSALIMVGWPFFFRFNLLRPLQRLMEGMRQVNAGQLAVSIPIQTHDEIGFLTQSFNEMTAQLHERTVALNQRAAEMEAVASMSSALRQAATSADMLPILTQEAVRALGATAGAVLLLDNGQLTVAHLQGLPLVRRDRRILPGAVPCWHSLLAGQVVQSSAEGEAPAPCVTCALHQTLLSRPLRLALAPLKTADQTLGVLEIAFETATALRSEHQQLLMALAEIAGSALHRAKTTEMLEQLVQSRTRDLAALYEVARITVRHLDMQVALENVLAQTLEVIGGTVGLIHLVSERNQLQRIAAQFAPQAPTNSVQALDETWSDTWWGRVMAQGEVVMVNAAEGQPTPTIEAQFNYVGAPIRVKDRLLGVLSVLAEARHTFSVEDIALLAGIADYLGMAVENARLHQRAESAAAQEERRRLARDLHDSVTQSLHSLSLSAQTATHLLKQNRLTPLAESLSRLDDSARQALKEMRLLLYELRLAPLKDINLVEVLHTRLEAVERRAGVETELLVEEPHYWPRPWEDELYCIAIEALNNSLRHARATHVRVRLHGQPGAVELEITDNGCGFDWRTTPLGGMGLSNMVERARRLGGELVIESAPGQGARIHFRAAP